MGEYVDRLVDTFMGRR